MQSVQVLIVLYSLYAFRSVGILLGDVWGYISSRVEQKLPEAGVEGTFLSSELIFSFNLIFVFSRNTLPADERHIPLDCGSCTISRNVAQKLSWRLHLWPISW